MEDNPGGDVGCYDRVGQDTAEFLSDVQWINSRHL